MVTKKELRTRYKQMRAAIPPDRAEALSLVLAQVAMRDPAFRSARTVHLFLPIRRLHEVDTYPLLEEVFRTGKTAVVSVSDFSSGRMSHYRLPAGWPLVENAYGIPEPADTGALSPVSPRQIDLVFVPLLAYDAQGARVGYGRGFYDRFLRECSEQTIRAGLSFFPPETEPVSDLSPQDVPLDCCFTPQGKITCSSRAV